MDDLLIVERLSIRGPPGATTAHRQVARPMTWPDKWWIRVCLRHRIVRTVEPEVWRRFFMIFSLISSSGAAQSWRRNLVFHQSGWYRRIRSLNRPVSSWWIQLLTERLIAEGFGLSIGWFETETYRSKYASADATFRREFGRSSTSVFLIKIAFPSSILDRKSRNFFPPRVRTYPFSTRSLCFAAT